MRLLSLHNILVLAATVLSCSYVSAEPRLHSVNVHSVNGFHDIDLNFFLDREDIAILAHPATQAKIASLLTGAYGAYGTAAAAYIAKRSAEIKQAARGNNASVKFSIRTVGLSGQPVDVINWVVGGCEKRC